MRLTHPLCLKLKIRKSTLRPRRCVPNYVRLSDSSIHFHAVYLYGLGTCSCLSEDMTCALTCAKLIIMIIYTSRLINQCEA